MTKNKFDKDIYMHGLCQYFAIEAAKLFNGKVCLWLDFDPVIDKTVLCHAYAEIAPGLFVDSYGSFSDLREREDEFEFSEQKIIICSIDEAKKILKNMEIPYSGTEEKKNAREFLRNNMITVDFEYNNNIYTAGLYYVNPEESKILVNMKNTYSFSDYISIFPYSDFGKNVIKHLGFIENKNWYHKH